MRQPKLWVSLFILVIIGLHVLPVISYQGYRQTRWPILAWAMYAKSYPPGPVETYNRWGVLMTAQGHRIELTAQMAGVARPALWKHYIRPLARGDTAVARELFARLNRNRTDSIVELRAEGERYVVTDRGLDTLALRPIIYYRPAPTSRP